MAPRMRPARSDGLRSGAERSGAGSMRRRRGACGSSHEGRIGRAAAARHEFSGARRRRSLGIRRIPSSTSGSRHPEAPPSRASQRSDHQGAPPVAAHVVVHHRRSDVTPQRPIFFAKVSCPAAGAAVRTRKVVRRSRSTLTRSASRICNLMRLGRNGRFHGVVARVDTTRLKSSGAATAPAWIPATLRSCNPSVVPLRSVPSSRTASRETAHHDDAIPLHPAEADRPHR